MGKIFSNLKIPKISVSGGKSPFGIAGKGKLPSFDVKWNAKGGILTQPTIFGVSGNTLLGGGKDGKEAIAPIETLQRYIREATAFNDEGIRRTLIEQFHLLMEFLEENMPHDIRMNGDALVGEMLPAIDTGLADRWNHTRRGNVR